MLALDQGTAGVLVAVITASASVLAVLIQSTRRVVTEARDEAKAANAEAKAATAAVNNVDPGTPPLVERVARIEQRQDAHSRWVQDSLGLIGAQLGVRLPDRRHYDQEVTT